ncbi:hypothetical protein HYC85_027966 [Camellia sinensis]|uniref:Uncharacterized protein n=1 Tax=Camellia sinensis TaxID=4442 RepID=A0A7J7FTV9_CAMSI|nr:hypothetical protein HYC85_027966 [Camellia sinensis]
MEFFLMPVDGRAFSVQNSAKQCIFDAQPASVLTSGRVSCAWHSNSCEVYPFRILLPFTKLKRFPHAHDIVSTVHLRLVQPDEPHRHDIVCTVHLQLVEPDEPHSFLCMIISYVRFCALSYILPLPSGAYLVCLACLSEYSALSKMGRLWALTFTPVIVMTFEFCQRGATVDTPFLTVLKTWTSPFEHPVIIHVCVRLDFPEVSAMRLTSGSPNSTV